MELPPILRKVIGERCVISSKEGGDAQKDLFAGVSADKEKDY